MVGVVGVVGVVAVVLRVEGVLGVAFSRVEFAVINHTLRTQLKFVYCSINKAYGEN